MCVWEKYWDHISMRAKIAWHLLHRAEVILILGFLIKHICRSMMGAAYRLAALEKCLFLLIVMAQLLSSYMERTCCLFQRCNDSKNTQYDPAGRKQHYRL